MNNIHTISVLSNENVQQPVADFTLQGKTFRDAIGIIIQTPVIGFVLSFDEWNDIWGDSDSIVTEGQSEVVALQTLSGFDLTKRICEAQKNKKGEFTAAQRCWKYDKGGLQWYLPCLYELGIIAAYKDKINEILRLLACSDDMLLSDGWYWSSSEYSQSNSWHVNFSTGSFYSYYKDNSSNVRAVAAFRPCGSSCDEPREVKSSASPETLSEEQLIALLRQKGYTGTLTKTLEI